MSECLCHARMIREGSQAITVTLGKFQYVFLYSGGKRKKDVHFNLAWTPSLLTQSLTKETCVWGIPLHLSNNQNKVARNSLGCVSTQEVLAHSFRLF